MKISNWYHQLDFKFIGKHKLRLYQNADDIVNILYVSDHISDHTTLKKICNDISGDFFIRPRETKTFENSTLSKYKSIYLNKFIFMCRLESLNTFSSTYMNALYYALSGMHIINISNTYVVFHAYLGLFSSHYVSQRYFRFHPHINYMYVYKCKALQ